jgi:hypothetical protein
VITEQEVDLLAEEIGAALERVAATTGVAA